MKESLKEPITVVCIAFLLVSILTVIFAFPILALIIPFYLVIIGFSLIFLPAFILALLVVILINELI